MSERAKGSQIEVGGQTLPEKLSDLQADINSKANAVAVSQALALKADADAVSQALALKADNSTVSQALTDKADKSQLNGLATETFVSQAVSGLATDTSVAGKADKTYVDTELGKKADSAAVTQALELKADASALATKADASALAQLRSDAVLESELTSETGNSTTKVMNQKGVTDAIRAAGGGASALADLTDVDFGTPSDGQVLTYDAATQKSKFTDPAGGGGGGIEEAPEDGQVYGRGSATWTPLPEVAIVLSPASPVIGDEMKDLLSDLAPLYVFKGEWDTDGLALGIALELTFTRVNLVEEEGDTLAIYKVTGSGMGSSPVDILGSIWILSSSEPSNDMFMVQVGMDSSDLLASSYSQDRTLLGISSTIAYSNGYALESKEVIIDSNGFIKESSPIISLFSDHLVSNKHSNLVGVVLDKTSTGVYELTNVPLLSRDGWYIETPKDRNNNIYFTLDYEEYPEENKLVIRTYEPDYSTGKASNGAPVDILEGRFVSLRFHEEPSQ